MSLENVKAFYERLATDEAFRTQVQEVKSKDECSQTVKSAGYDFTQEEFEEYTADLLELSADEDKLAELDEKELATIFAGATVHPMYGVIVQPEPQPLYGVVMKPPEPQPLYGVVMRSPE
ncbi:MAG: Nif11-like leader peptide family natural product precursor [Brasilonema angustatum HA4187-MV1]|jgi:predicted ribosomally synthesized peptide with nif11-like leader|nr:Nif11-like leader peptide family natural product precursor [Brasilonema angustatum HA4187-MV1]